MQNGGGEPLFHPFRIWKRGIRRAEDPRWIFAVSTAERDLFSLCSDPLGDLFPGRGKGRSAASLRAVRSRGDPLVPLVRLDAFGGDFAGGFLPRACSLVSLARSFVCLAAFPLFQKGKGAFDRPREENRGLMQGVAPHPTRSFLKKAP